MKVALYLHFPYCVSRCTYCDFNAYEKPEGSQAQEQYLHALLADIRQTSKSERFNIQTVFCGGGTPSLYSAQAISSVFDACRQSFEWRPSEVTLEANPGTVSLAQLRELREIGVNRLSLGVQALQGDLLRRLNRIHSPQEVQQAVEWARISNFQNLSLDLIYGLPGQTLSDWEETLDLALSLQPEHFSIYQLIVEPGTRLEAQIRTRQLRLPSESLVFKMDRLSRRRLRQRGYHPYEISNWCKPGFHSRHNRVYWQDRPYLGLGCGATGYVNGWRARRILHPEIYARVVSKGGSPIISAERMGQESALKDTLMMGLRTCWGVSLPTLQRRYPDFRPENLDLALAELPQTWFERKGQYLRLTRQGADFATEVQHRLMDCYLTTIAWPATAHPPQV